MKIKAKNSKAVAGIRLIVPVDGLIIIDGEGCVEVSAACAEALVKGTSDWDYAESAAEEPLEEEPIEKDEREKFVEELESMTVAQMKELCKEGGFPEDEWKSLKKKTLAAYLLEKFDEAAEEVSEEALSPSAPVTASPSVEEEEEELEEEELEEEEVEEEK